MSSKYTIAKQADENIRQASWELNQQRLSLKDKIMAKGKYEKWLSEDGLLLLEGWARSGLTNVQIAAKMGINPDTLYTYISKYTDIAEALNKGKEIVDFKVENALLKRALGYDIVETVYDNSGHAKKIEKHIKPDVRAQIIWLSNRKPKYWRKYIAAEAIAEEADTDTDTNTNNDKLKEEDK